MQTTPLTEPLWRSALNRSELEAHRAFLEAALPHLQTYPEIIGILGAGSLITGMMDEFSDIAGYRRRAGRLRIGDGAPLRNRRFAGFTPHWIYRRTCR